MNCASLFIIDTTFYDSILGATELRLMLILINLNLINLNLLWAPVTI